MSTIEELIERLTSFRLFSVVRNSLLQIISPIKSKIWTIEILTRYMNEIISQFLNSHNEQIDYFFEDFLMEKFADDSVAKQKFCFTFLVSLLKFERQHNYIKFYRKLFEEQAEYEIYHCFWELRSLVFDLTSVSHSMYANLDKIYLNQKRWHLILNCFFGYGSEQIFAFEAQLLEKISEVKHHLKEEKVINYVRNNEYCATFFIREAIRQFLDRHILEKHHLEVPDESENISNQRHTLLDQRRYTSVMQRISQVRHSRLTGLPMMDNPDDLLNAKLMEKERMLAEIKHNAQQTNAYKLSTVKLLTYIDEIDPIAAQAKEIFQKVRSAFQSTKSSLRGDAMDKFSNQLEKQTLKFIDQGSALNVKNGVTAKRSLMKLGQETYSTITDRVQDHKPSIKVLIEELRRVIFHEQFALARDERTKNLEHIKQELEKLFGKYGSLRNSDRIILETVYQNLELQNEKGSNIEGLLERVSQKLSKALLKGLSEGKILGSDGDEAVIEKEIEEVVNNEIKRFNSIKADAFSEENQIPLEFKKNRYSIKPLSEKRATFVKEAGISVLEPIKEMAPKKFLLNFGQSKMVMNKEAGPFNPQSKRSSFVSNNLINSINKEWNEKSFVEPVDIDLPEEALSRINDIPRSSRNMSQLLNNPEIQQMVSEHLIESQAKKSSHTTYRKSILNEAPRIEPTFSEPKKPSMSFVKLSQSIPIPEEPSLKNSKNESNEPSKQQKSISKPSMSKLLAPKEMPAFNTFNPERRGSRLTDYSLKSNSMLASAAKELQEEELIRESLIQSSVNPKDTNLSAKRDGHFTKKAEVFDEVPKNLSMSRMSMKLSELMPQKSIQTDQNDPKISLEQEPEAIKRDTLMKLSMPSHVDDPPKKSESILKTSKISRIEPDAMIKQSDLTMSSMSKIAPELDQNPEEARITRKFSTKNNEPEISLSHLGNSQSLLPEVLNKSEIDTTKKNEVKKHKKAKQGPNIPMMKSKQGVHIAKEIGMIDDGKPKTFKNFFSSFWGK